MALPVEAAEVVAAQVTAVAVAPALERRAMAAKPSIAPEGKRLMVWFFYLSQGIDNLYWQLY